MWQNLGNIKGPDGKSAYDIAVDEGFTGTKLDWLTSLESLPKFEDCTTHPDDIWEDGIYSFDKSVENPIDAVIDDYNASFILINLTIPSQYYLHDFTNGVNKEGIICQQILLSTYYIDIEFDSRYNKNMFQSSNPDVYIRTRAKNTSGLLYACGWDKIANSSDVQTLRNEIKRLPSKLFPVGSVYITMNDTNPQGWLGGTWEQFSQGRVLLGAGAYGSTNYSAGETGGSTAVTLTEPQIPKHDHGVFTIFETFDEVTNNDKLRYSIRQGSYEQWLKGKTKKAKPLNFSDYTGGSQPHNNMMPYIVVYFWERVA